MSLEIQTEGGERKMTKSILDDDDLVGKIRETIKEKTK